MIPFIFYNINLTSSVQAGAKVLLDALASPAKKIAGVASRALSGIKSNLATYKEKKATQEVLQAQFDSKRNAAAQTFSDNNTKPRAVLDQKKSDSFFGKLKSSIYKFDQALLTQHLEENRTNKEAILSSINEDLKRSGAEDRLIIFPDGTRKCYSLVKLENPVKTMLNDLREEPSLRHLTEDRAIELISLFGQATQRLISAHLFIQVGDDLSAVPGSTTYALSTLDLRRPQSPKMTIESNISVWNMSRGAQLDKTIDLKVTISNLSKQTTAKIETKQGKPLPSPVVREHLIADYRESK